MKAAIYARVSTTDQTNAIQVRELKDYVERRGWTLSEVYPDQMSGAKASRPGLDQLMADARRRRFDAVVVWKLDRFGRSLVHCISGIQELSSLGIRFLATSQGLDTDESKPGQQAAPAYFGGGRAIRTGIDPRAGERRNEGCPETRHQDRKRDRAPASYLQSR